MELTDRSRLEEARRAQIEALRLMQALRACGAPLVVLDLEGSPRVESDAWVQAASAQPGLADALHDLCGELTAQTEATVECPDAGHLTRTPLLDGRGSPVGYLVALSSHGASEAEASPLQRSFERALRSAAGVLEHRGVEVLARCHASVGEAAADWSDFEERVFDQLLEHATAARGRRIVAELRCDPDPCVDVWLDGEPSSLKRVSLEAALRA